MIQFISREGAGESNAVIYLHVQFWGYIFAIIWATQVRSTWWAGDPVKRIFKAL